MKLRNKTIVVTGAASGIGAEVARLARFQGATVIGMDRNEPGLTLDGFVAVDMSQTASIDAAIAQLPQRVDALCNIAGVPGTADPALLAKVNYLGLRHLTEGVLPEAMLAALKPGAVVPALLVLAHEDAPTRTILCAGAGSFEAAHITLTQGLYLGAGADVPEQLAARLAQVTDRQGEQVPGSGMAQGMAELQKALAAQTSS